MYQIAFPLVRNFFNSFFTRLIQDMILSTNKNKVNSIYQFHLLYVEMNQCRLYQFHPFFTDLSNRKCLQNLKLRENVNIRLVPCNLNLDSIFYSFLWSLFSSFYGLIYATLRIKMAKNLLWIDANFELVWVTPPLDAYSLSTRITNFVSTCATCATCATFQADQFYPSHSHWNS